MSARSSSEFSGESALDAILLQLSSYECTHFYTDGEWSMHHLLTALLQITGPADVYLSTYAVSETSCRTLAQLRNDKGVIKSLSCVIDNRVDTRSANSLQLLRGISDRIILRACHAKATVIMGDQCSITVIGSANYTENKRMEVGIIDTTVPVADFHRSWITKILDENEH